MQIKRNICLFLLVVILAALSSCSVSRRASSRYQSMSQQALITLEMDKDRYSLRGSVRLWKNELVVLSAQVFGVEMARIEATPDSIWAFDKMNRRYTSLSYNDLGTIANKKINYKTIQELALKPIEEDQMKMEFTHGKHQVKVSCKFANREYNTLQAPTRTPTDKYKRVTLREILPL